MIKKKMKLISNLRGLASVLFSFSIDFRDFILDVSPGSAASVDFFDLVVPEFSGDEFSTESMFLRVAEVVSCPLPTLY